MDSSAPDIRFGRNEPISRNVHHSQKYWGLPPEKVFASKIFANTNAHINTNKIHIENKYKYKLDVDTGCHEVSEKIGLYGVERHKVEKWSG